MTYFDGHTVLFVCPYTAVIFSFLRLIKVYDSIKSID